MIAARREDRRFATRGYDHLTLIMAAKATLVAATLVLCAWWGVVATNAVAVNVEVSGTVVGRVDSTFRGFTTDWWLPDGPFGAKWGTGGILDVDLSNENLIYLVKQLAPATWRVGGTPEDTVRVARGAAWERQCERPWRWWCRGQVVYNVGGAPECPIPHQNPYPGQKCLNMTRWEEISAFAASTGVDLVFGLSGWYGRPDSDSPMNISNAASLFQYTVKRQLAVAGFELSNEDNTGGPTKRINATACCAPVSVLSHC